MAEPDETFPRTNREKAAALSTFHKHTECVRSINGWPPPGSLLRCNRRILPRRGSRRRCKKRGKKKRRGGSGTWRFFATVAMLVRVASARSDKNTSNSLLRSISVCLFVPGHKRPGGGRRINWHKGTRYDSECEGLLTVKFGRKRFKPRTPRLKPSVHCLQAKK